jgi:hypothetical protein
MSCVHGSTCEIKSGNWDTCKRLQEEVEKWVVLGRAREDYVETARRKMIADSTHILYPNKSALPDAKGS